MSTFANHPAFDPTRARSLRIANLNDIRAVLPVEADVACQAVWSAMHDPMAEAGALAALNALPDTMQADIRARSLAYGAERGMMRRRG